MTRRRSSSTEIVLTVLVIAVIIVIAAAVRLAIAEGDIPCAFATDPALCMAVKGSSE